MKVVKIKDFAYKHCGKKSAYSIYFIEGLQDYMVLVYNIRSNSFILSPIKPDKQEEDIEKIIKDIEGKVSIISKLKIKTAPHDNIHEIYLGSAKFYLSCFENDFERDFYMEQAKNANLHITNQNKNDTLYRLKGFADHSYNIEDLANNLEKIDINEYQKQPQQVSANKETCIK